MKICRRCKREKAEEFFGKKNSWCKECMKEYVRQYRKEHDKPIREYKRRIVTVEDKPVKVDTRIKCCDSCRSENVVLKWMAVCIDCRVVTEVKEAVISDELLVPEIKIDRYCERCKDVKLKTENKREIYCVECKKIIHKEVKDKEDKEMADYIFTRYGITTSICSRCHMRLPVIEFNKSPATDNGLSRRCKKCIPTEQRRLKEEEYQKSLELRMKNEDMQ